MVAFIMVSLIGLLGVAVAWPFAKRRPIGAPLSWGQAVAAATYVFFLFFWWYGVIPDRWLAYADNELGWTIDNYLIEPNAFWPVTISWLIIRDFIVLGIYGLGVALHVGAWAVWQDRGKEKPVSVPASRYGRPLVRES